MKTIFVINEDTGKVAGAFNTDQQGDTLIFEQKEKLNYGVLTLSVKLDVIEVPVGDAIALTVIVPEDMVDDLILEDLIN